MSALCFSIHLYNLLVRQKERTSQTLHRAYICSIIIIPILMTLIVAYFSIKYDAIQPFELSCDIKEPKWVKMVGYPGFNLIITIIGAYFSIRAVAKVFSHLDHFKSQMTDMISTNKSTTEVNEINRENEANEANEANETGVRNDHYIRNIQKSYNLTKAAAIRMVLFSLGFTIVNILASVQSVLLVIKKGDDKTTGVRTADFALSFSGIIIYLIFGLPSVIKKRLSRS
ncbi:hypothetical protein RclHR1_04580012 [Rhizophagus clarus]|nr:hypothetical protein RclHR1_04580012 [Rhizophagus clarus]